MNTPRQRQGFGGRRWREAASVLRPVLAAYAALGVVLWFVPLLRILHVESSAVVAFAAFFIAGVSSLALYERGYTARRMLGMQEAMLLVPWMLLTASLIWETNCGYPQGLLFYLLFPVTTVFFSVGLAYALAALAVQRKRLWLVGIGVGIAVLGPVYDLGFHPQFYTYNHVFGGVLGPIYDVELAVRPGLFAFRGLTLLWGVLFFQFGVRARRSAQGIPVWARLPIVAVLLLGIGACYVFSARLGINTPAWYLREQLPGRYSTAHFNIYYQPAEVSEGEIRLIALDHEYQYQRLARLLDVRVGERIDSYLYPDEDVKAQLTGARLTNVAPVWLSRPQTHVLVEHYDDVFPHELAHVFSREFGLPVLRATLSAGLVEGVAVALEPPDRLPPPHEQVLAAMFLEEREGMPELVGDVAARLSPLGFWSGRGAVSYTTMGSFVRYLLDTYGAGPLKAVYAWGNFEKVYGRPLPELAAGWQEYLLARPRMARASADVVLRRFTVPSLFEVRCPHFVPEYLQAYRQGTDLLERGDTVQALQQFTASLEDEPSFSPALAEWGRIKLAQHAPQEVVMRLDTTALEPESPGVEVVWGDAYAVRGDASEARLHYTRAAEQVLATVEDVQTVLLLRQVLAGRDEVIRVLTTGHPPEQRSRLLAEPGDSHPAVQIFRALLLAEAKQFEEAVEVLQTVQVQEVDGVALAERRMLERQRLVWLADWSYRSGDWVAAEQYALQAVEVYRRAGHFSGEEAVEELVDKIRWVREEITDG